MPIRWKVLTHSRRSAYAEGKYSLQYPKGATIKAVPGTIGIMVFDTFKSANGFIHNNTLIYKIVKVNAIGRGKRRPYICNFISESAIEYFYKLIKYRLMISPLGTICYPMIEVLE